MTQNDYTAPNVKVLAVNLHDMLLTSGVKKIFNNDVFTEDLDGDIN